MRQELHDNTVTYQEQLYLLKAINRVLYFRHIIVLMGLMHVPRLASTIRLGYVHVSTVVFLQQYRVSALFRCAVITDRPKYFLHSLICIHNLANGNVTKVPLDIWIGCVAHWHASGRSNGSS